jgi:hypothetical protein
LTRPCRSTYWRSAPVDTPATGVLGTDADGDPIDGLSLVLSAPYGIFPAFRPDIHSLLSPFCFFFNTKRSHELALIRIGQYLKGTRTKGPTFKPDPMSCPSLDVYVDSDFRTLRSWRSQRPNECQESCWITMLLNNCPWFGHHVNEGRLSQHNDGRILRSVPLYARSQFH